MQCLVVAAIQIGPYSLILAAKSTRNYLTNVLFVVLVVVLHHGQRHECGCSSCSWLSITSL